MVNVTKLKLDVNPNLKVTSNKNKTPIYATFVNKITPKANYEPVSALKFQPHPGFWQYERLTVTSGSSIYIWAIRRPYKPDFNNIGWIPDGDSDVFKWCSDTYKDAQKKYRSYTTATAKVKQRTQQMLMVPVAPKKIDAHKEATVKPYDPLNDPPPSVLLSMLNIHGKNFVLSMQWSPSGAYFASMDSNNLFLVFYYGSNVKAMVPKEKDKNMDIDNPEDVINASYTLYVEKGDTFNQPNAPMELWSLKTNIRAETGSELKDFCYIDDQTIAVASLKAIFIYQVKIDAKKQTVDKHLFKKLPIVSEGGGVMISSLTCDIRGETLCALCTDGIIRNWSIEYDAGTFVIAANPNIINVMDTETHFFGQPRFNFDVTGGIIGLPLGYRLGDNLGLVAKIKNLHESTESTEEGGVYLRLRGHQARINALVFGPCMYSLKAPHIPENTGIVPIDEIIKAARIHEAWPLYSMAAVASTDGAVSFWRIFDSGTGPRHLEGQCILVFVPRFLDEQGTVTDIGWTPDGTCACIGSDDGSMTLVGFSPSEIDADIATTAFDEWLSTIVDHGAAQAEGPQAPFEEILDICLAAQARDGEDGLESPNFTPAEAISTTTDITDIVPRRIKKKTDSPLKNDSTGKTDSPSKNDRLGKTDSPLKRDSPRKSDTPAKNDIPVKKTPVKNDIPVKKTPVKNDIAVKRTQAKNDIAVKPKSEDKNLLLDGDSIQDGGIVEDGNSTDNISADTEKSTEKNTEKDTEKNTEKSTEKSKEKSKEKSNEESKDKSTEKGVSLDSNASPDSSKVDKALDSNKLNKVGKTLAGKDHAKSKARAKGKNKRKFENILSKEIVINENPSIEPDHNIEGLKTASNPLVSKECMDSPNNQTMQFTTPTCAKEPVSPTRMIMKRYTDMDAPAQKSTKRRRKFIQGESIEQVDKVHPDIGSSDQHQQQPYRQTTKLMTHPTHMGYPSPRTGFMPINIVNNLSPPVVDSLYPQVKNSPGTPIRRRTASPISSRSEMLQPDDEPPALPPQPPK